MWGAAYDDSGRVFTMEDGRPLKLQYVTRLFEKLRAKAKLPKMTLHGTRHQQASLQLAAGTPLAVVSKRLGHSSVAVTADIYSHCSAPPSTTRPTTRPRSCPPGRPMHAHCTHKGLRTKKRPPPRKRKQPLTCGNSGRADRI